MDQLTGLEQTYVEFCYHCAIVKHNPLPSTLNAIAPGIGKERRAVLDAMVREQVTRKRERDLLAEEQKSGGY